MRILVANDDGVGARGLALLEAVAHKLGDEVWVIAPDGERSWTGRSHTVFHPIRIEETGERRFTCSGTPADGVMFALRTLMADTPPDLVLCGINHGSNLGEEVGYSGTMAATMEGTVAGVRSIGLSQLYDPMTRVIPWAVSEAHVEPLVRRLIALGWPPEVLLSVNLPPLADPAAVQGVRFTRLAQGNMRHGRYLAERRLDHHGRPYYWAGFRPRMTDDDPETDVGAVQRGFIAVTPLHLDMTHTPTLHALS